DHTHLSAEEGTELLGQQVLIMLARQQPDNLHQQPHEQSRSDGEREPQPAPEVVSNRQNETSLKTPGPAQNLSSPAGRCRLRLRARWYGQLQAPHRTAWAAEPERRGPALGEKGRSGQQCHESPRAAPAAARLTGRS